MSGHRPPRPVSQPNPLANTKRPLFGVPFSCFSCFAILYRKLLKRKPTSTTTTTADLNHPRRFSYSVLLRATSSFSPSNRLGQGAFGSVFRGVLRSGQKIAVKVMDSGSLQSEREFQNELSFAGNVIDSNYIVSLIGFTSDSKKNRGQRKLVLVYELMDNGSLQDALFNRKCPELMDWKKRFEIAFDVAKGLEFLHFGCNPPVIHGDVKPSNVLLDKNLNAKIADFGLALVKREEDCEAVEETEQKERLNGSDCNEENMKEKEDDKFLKEDAASVASDTSNSNSLLEESPESFMKILDSEASPEIVKHWEDQLGMIGNKKIAETQKNFDESCSDNGGHEKLKRTDQPGRVKEHVMEWILTEIKGKEKKSDQVARKWWREEFYEELDEKKNKKKMKKETELDNDNWWQDYEDLDHTKQKKIKEKKKKKKSHRRSSWGSIEWWSDGFSEESSSSNKTPKSSICSNLSMRGTVCYTAPEYGSCIADQRRQLSEKCDVYSYGVLLLVVVSGRRPLQVTLSSPKSELERANLVSWARRLAYKGKLVDLVDPNLQSVDHEQAVLCIKVALLCLQRSASRRPTIRQVVEILSGKRDLPRRMSL